jgi:putative ATP-binding cassette transporter
MRGLGPSLRDAWRLAAPFFNSSERWSARGLLAALIGLSLALVGASVVLSYWQRAFYNALQEKDWDAFVSLILFYRHTPTGIMPGFCAVAAVYILVSISRSWLSQYLRIRWRRWMTERLQREWLTDHAYWRIFLASGTKAAAHGTDNPDQRIADDINDFVTTTLSLTLGLLSSLVTLFSFVTILWTLSGAVHLLGIAVPGYMVWVALLYAAAGTALTHLVGRPLAGLEFHQQRVEADFRFGLARMRENMEGIALYGGEAEEATASSGRFAAIVTNWRQIMHRTLLLNLMLSGYGQIAVIFPLVVAAPRYFAGEIALGALMQTTGAFASVEGAMSWFVNSYSTLAGWRATVERLASFDRAVAAARASQDGIELATSPDTSYRADGLTLALPDGTALLTDAALRLAPGRATVITGRSGLGKSTLFRALAGLWPLGRGHIARPTGKSLFLPQRPYIPLGTLRRAILYPAPADSQPTETLIRTLDAVGLGHLAPRLDAEEPWAQRLSGGEQQRLAIARALLAAPDWLFLDEATASLDPTSEAELYGLLARRLPDTTIVSIAHRTSVAALHDDELALARDADGVVRLHANAPA